MLALVLGFQPFIQRVYASDTLTIDVFTQKEPYGGRGPNQPCDAFAPGEKVFLYALVLDNSIPAENEKVIFDIYGPADPSDNNRFSLSALTNASGIAATSFVLPWPPQCFGEWTIYASANISGIVIRDFTWFTVYWIVEILWIETGELNGYWISESVFPKGSLMDIKVALKNIAWVEKNVSIGATIYDSIGTPIAHSDLLFIISAKSIETVYVEDLFIPKWAFSCSGNVIVTVLTEEGDYCPEKNQTIKILPCYYVGGTSFIPNKTRMSQWVTAITLMIFVLITSIAKKKCLKSTKFSH